MTRNYFKVLCNLYELDFNEAMKKINNDTKRYVEIVWGLLDKEVLQKELNNIKRVCNRMETKEGYALCEEITKEEVENVTMFNLDNMFKSINDMTLEQFNARKIIINHVIPKIFVKYAETYTTERYENMLYRVYG